MDKSAWAKASSVIPGFLEKIEQNKHLLKVTCEADPSGLTNDAAEPGYLLFRKEVQRVVS